MAVTGRILVAGEALVDLTRGVGDTAFVPHPGGGPCNTSVALGRLGVPTSFLGPLGDDVFGRQIRRHLDDSGVDLTYAPDTGLPTTLAVATVDEAGKADYSFYLDGTTASSLEPASLPDPLPTDTAMVHVGTLGLVLEPTASTLESLVDDVAGDIVVFLDPNVRVPAIRDMSRYHRRIVALARNADIIKLSDDDARALHPDLEPMDVAQRLSGLGPSIVVLTRGGDGVSALHGGTTVTRGAPEVDVADTIGAGDSFSAGLITWLSENGRLSKDGIADLTTDEVSAALDFAGAVAALTVSRHGANPPRRSEIA